MHAESPSHVGTHDVKQSPAAVCVTSGASSGTYIKRRLVVIVARWLHLDGGTVGGRFDGDGGRGRVARVVAEAVVDQTGVDVVAVALLVCGGELQSAGRCYVRRALHVQVNRGSVSRQCLWNE